jgi:divalent metal cation (Fe/Co/Zn/Cd) transporter
MPTDDVASGSLLDAASRYDIVEIINKGLAYAILIAGILSVIFIFIGGISFILSGGQEDKIKQAVSTIRYAIIGLIITMFSVIIVGVVGRFLGFNVIRYLNFDEIIRNITSITSDVGGSGGNSLD